MIKKRRILILALVFCLTASFIVASVGYDPWVDLDDDGYIGPSDFALFAGQYGTSGTPINKTELLLELQSRIDSLNLTLLTDYYNITVCDVTFVDASGDTITGYLYVLGDMNVTGYLNVDLGTLYVDEALNRVGIGTIIPTTKLDVAGALRADEIRIGSTEGNHVIWFYEGGALTEYFYWQDSGDKFILSDDMYISGSLSLSGTIEIPATLRYYTIPGSAWQPYSSTYAFARGVYTYTTTAGSTGWYAPVNLPHGAVVVELRAWIWDADAGYDVDVELWRATGSTTYEMAGVSSSGSSPAFVQYDDDSVSYATVDNINCAYFLYGNLRSGNSNHRLGQVRIRYRITETLP